MLSPHPRDKLVCAGAPTWLDRELVAVSPEPLPDAGFGHDARAAQAQRRQWLIAQGLAEEQDGRTVYRANMIATLQRRSEERRVGNECVSTCRSRCSP